MLFKMEFIEGSSEEKLVYQNPYPRTEVLIATSREGTDSDKTALVIRHLETATLRGRPGFSLYGRTRPQK